ncbi:MAG TPA: 50S ribosomal protein L4 [Acidimicrobiia bacterium]|jgi:large subunit ribosomal protein L4
MSSVTIKTATGGDGASIELDDALFGIEPNMPVMHQVVTAQLAHRRAGTHSTKTRAEVSGGGAKPWRQKGTGRARQGSIRAPQWRGGGVAHGPKPRDYSKKVNKKVVALALRSALSDRAASERVVVVDDWGISEPKTKRGIELLGALGLRPTDRKPPRVLVVLFREDDAVWKSLRNIGGRVQVVLPEELNTYDVLVSDYIVFSRATLDAVTVRFGGAASAEGAPNSPAENSAVDTSADDTSDAGAATTDDDATQGDE